MSETNEQETAIPSPSPPAAMPNPYRPWATDVEQATASRAADSEMFRRQYLADFTLAANSPQHRMEWQPHMPGYYAANPEAAPYIRNMPEIQRRAAMRLQIDAQLRRLMNGPTSRSNFLDAMMDMILQAEARGRLDTPPLPPSPEPGHPDHIAQAWERVMQAMVQPLWLCMHGQIEMVDVIQRIIPTLVGERQRVQPTGILRADLIRGRSYQVAWDMATISGQVTATPWTPPPAPLTLPPTVAPAPRPRRRVDRL